MVVYDNQQSINYIVYARAQHYKAFNSVTVFCLLTEILVKLDMKTKPANAHKCMKAYCTHRTPSICFGHSCGLPQGAAMQRTDTRKYDKDLNQWTDIKY
jgi:hypothetical protein